MAVLKATPASHRRATSKPASATAAGILPALCIAGAVALLHVLTNGRYGFHRDELQFLSDAHHLDWGFVSYPPLAPLLARLSLTVFGDSLAGLRFFPVLAQSAAIVITSLTAKELGGRRLAQVAAAAAIAFSPLPLFEATKFQYTSFDYLWWVLIAYLTVRLLKSENPRWWLAIGAAVGLGFLTKYSILFCCAGLIAGMVLTRERRQFRNLWFWGGVALSLLICLPNLLWQVRQGFISWQFLQAIHARDIELGRTRGFLIEQITNCLNIFAWPLCLAGLISFLRSQRYRMLGWMYLVPLVLLAIAQGRSYYLGGAYPALIAMGAVVFENWLSSGQNTSVAPPASRRRGEKPKSNRPSAAPRYRQAVAVVFFVALAAWGSWSCAILLPIQSSGPLRDFALRRNEDLRDEFGWDELVRTVAGIRDSMPPGQQAHVGIVVGNYGEQGAIEILGRSRHLPPPISGANSAWLRGYPTPQPTVLIVLGFRGEQADSMFSGCRLAGHNANSQGIPNEESQDHPDIFLCGPPRLPWPEFWANFRYFE